MKKLYCFIFASLLVLQIKPGFSQSSMPKSEISPSRNINDSRFIVEATAMDNDTWCFIEWPGTREFLHIGDNRDIDYYQIDRFSNFDPNGSPLTGVTTFLDTVSVSEYHDYDWAMLPMGWFAYGVKEHYTSGEWSDYNVSNIVGHLNSFTVTFNINLCDTTWWEYTVFTFCGEIYPIDMEGGGGSISFELNSLMHCDVSVYAPGNDTYTIENALINADKVFNIFVSCSKYMVRNLYVDPVSLHVGWDPPQVVCLDQDFEADYFPPAGWQATSEGDGWFKSTDGSSGGWNIPEWIGNYACTNDLLPGNDNDGSMDYLITPTLDLKYRFNNFLTFYSYFDGTNGQEAFVEYSFDGLYRDTLYELEPSTSWEYVEIDLSALSGPEGDWVMFAFHADDNGQDASGWAIDSLRIFSPEPPYPLTGYWVFLNDSLIATTDTNFLDLPELTYDEEYTLKVKAQYLSGLSSAEWVTFTSHYLTPPSCFYQADTGNMPLIICPPLDSTGTVPFNFIGYNLYKNDELVTFLPPSSLSYDPDWPQPCKFHYRLIAVFDLTPFGYPGETGESMPMVTDYTVRWGFELPFLEQWNLGTFETSNWTIDGSNWSINGNEGNPDPTAEFTWDPIQNDYSISLESYPLLANSMTEGQIHLDFDIMLSSFQATGSELLLVQVWNWESQMWATAETYSNEEGSFGWVSENLDISDYAMNQVFKIRFVAEGEYSLNIVSWFIDNIHIYRACNPPLNLDVSWGNYGLDLTWDYPLGSGFGDQWVHWDDGLNYGNSIGGPLVFDVAARWEPEQLVLFEGGLITEIAFFPGEQAATYNVRVWVGSGDPALIIDQTVENPLVNQWNYVTLDNPHQLDISQELWVGYHINAMTGYPAGVDNGPAIDGYGNMMKFGFWQTLLEINPELDYNWNIMAFLHQTINNDSITKYAIYRSDDVEPYFLRAYTDTNFYVDDSAICESTGIHCYKVTAVNIQLSDTCESSPSNEACEICEGIDEKNTEFNLAIYPNPASDLLHVESLERLQSISIYDARGDKVIWWEGDKAVVEIPVNELVPGLYLVRVETYSGTIGRKVIISR